MATAPNYSQPAIFSEVATPTVPDSGYLKVYGKDGALCSIVNGGTEKSYVAISGSGLPIGAYTLPTTDGTSSQVLQTNGSGTVTWQTVSGGGGGGITSINGDTTAAQLLTVGTSGTDFAIDSVTTAGTSVFNIPDASATARGLITTGTQTIAGTKTFAGDLLFTDATYDIGKSGATRPRDGFFSRNLTADKLSVGGASLTGYINLPAFQWINWGGTNYIKAGNSYDGVVGVTLISGGTLADVGAIVPYNNALKIRYSTNAQTLQVYETYTSDTSFGTFQIKANAGAAYQIGSAIGSAGGTNRAIDFGHWNSAGTFTSALSIATTSIATFANDILGQNLRIQAAEIHAHTGTGLIIRGTLFASAPTLSLQTGGAASMRQWALYGGESSQFICSGNSNGAGTGYLFIGSGSGPTTNPASTTNRILFDTLAGRTIFRNVSGQTANSIEVQDSAASVLAAITAAGSFTCTGATLTQPVSTTGSPTAFTITGAAHTTLTLSTEATDVNFNLARTVQFATGALTTQRAMRIQAPTYSFVGASTITTASTLSISGPPVAGTNATITNAYALNVESGNSYFAGNVRAVGSSVYAPSYGFGSDNSGFFRSSTSRVFLGLNGNVQYDFNSGSLCINSGSYGVAGGSVDSNSADVLWVRDGAGIWATRNGTNAQTFRLYNTYTSSTSYENLQFKANAGAAYQIGSAIGSAGGTNRDLNFGSWDTAGTFTSSFYTSSTYAGINDSKIFYVGTSSRIEFSALSSLASPAIRFAWGGGSPACVYGGSNTLGVGINGFTRLLFGVSSTDFTGSPFTISNTAVATGAYTGFTYTGAAHTNQTASTEATMVNWNLAQTVEFATGALTTQRAMRIQAPTYSFVGASTITTASTLSISGPPIAGTNATITRSFALVAEAGDIAVANTAKLCLDTSGYAWIQGTSASGGGYVVDFYNRYSSNPQIKLSSSALILQAAVGGLVFTTSASVGTIDTGIARNAAATIEINTGIVGTYGDLICRKVTTRNTTTATSIEVTGTYTSSTSYEKVNIRGKASANFEIGPENGSAGGTLRGFTIGGYSAGSSTITPWLSFTSSGTPTVDQGTLVIPSGGTGLLCQQTNIYLDSYGTHSGIRYRRSEGTQGSPTAVANNSLLGFFATYGYHGAGYHSTQGCAISFYATETYTAGAQGSKIVFGTTPNGTAVLATALTIDQNQVATFSKLVAQSAAEITSTPSGTTQTITLNNGNHQTLTLTSSTGAVTVTLTVPSNVSSGTIIVKQHGTTPRNITWAVSAGTIKWMGTQPTWSSDAANDIRIVSWRYDGSVMYLMSTDKAA